MASEKNLGKLGQNRPLMVAIIVIIVLLVAVAFETILIIEQKRTSESIEAQTNRAFSKFMQGGKSPSREQGTDILFRNVRFCWSPAVCINADKLTATAIPLDGTRDVVFDNLKSFIVKVHNSTVLISPKTLQGMFNESVFNYPGSTLRDLAVDINTASGANHVKLSGSLNYVFWIPFEMDTDLKVDKNTNTLLISVNDLKVFSVLPLTWILKFKPFNLEKLLPLPANKHLSIRTNTILVKPFGLFPPPRIDGKMSSIVVTSKWIQLMFEGNDPPFSNIPQSNAANYIYLQGGNGQFGKIKLYDTQAQVIDKKPGDLFQFSLVNYLSYFPSSGVTLLPSGGAVLEMDDHRFSKPK